MLYSSFKDKELSLLGFGTMRLPLLPGGGSGDIDQDAVNAMVDYALEHGVNYFDTAVPYHASRSEGAIGTALSRHPRESFYLADKYPGHQFVKHYDPAATFEEQLRRCGVDYFDFYLMHNVSESSIPVYTDKELGIVDYFIEQRRLGRIKHLGFSCHADADTMKGFLDTYDGVFEFCQIQLNYLDWTLQNAKAKYEMLTERGIPVWVMEPVRGGKLAKFDSDTENTLHSLRPGESCAAWGFRFLQGLPNVKVILSGMSDLEQMKDNVKTFTERKPLNAMELAVALSVAENIKNSVPCTGCRYCCDGCPMGINIPKLIAIYTDLRLQPHVNISIRLGTVPKDKLPSACIGCGQCQAICPQKINVPELMQTMDEAFSTVPSWLEICREREEADLREKAAKQDT